MKRDPVHRKIMKTRDAFIDEDHFDPDEAHSQKYATCDCAIHALTRPI